jgi:hypothetical protein
MGATWREYNGWKIELITEQVGEQWICQQIRVSHDPRRQIPLSLTLHRGSRRSWMR